MKDIHEVLRRKQAQYAQLGKQIEALQAAAESLRSVEALLAEDGDDFAEPAPSVPASEEHAPAYAAKAAAASTSAGPTAPQPTTVKPGRPVAPRWP
jgi:hypothetical protein